MSSPMLIYARCSPLPYRPLKYPPSGCHWEVGRHLRKMSKVQDALRVALAPVHHLAVTDVTDGHAVEGVLDGRALRADGREILVLVVSAAFDGQSLIDRQRAVNAVLAEDLSTGKPHHTAPHSITHYCAHCCVHSITLHRTLLHTRHDTLPHVCIAGVLHSVRMKCWTPAQWERQGAPHSFPLAVHLASKCTKAASPSAEYSPVSVIMATPTTTTVMEEAPLRLPASAHPVRAQKKQDSLFVCEGGCGLALF